MTGLSRFAFSLLFLFLLLGTSSAFAGEFCSTFPDPNNPGAGLIDGSDPATVQFFINNNVTQVTIDTDCTFRNWNPLKVTVNFQTNDPSIYLITFDNVVFTGNMACANIDHRLWVVNSPVEEFSFKCQDIFIPTEAISKQVPAGKTTVGIGEAFTYTLTIPVLIDPATGTPINSSGTDVDLHSIIVKDDLNAIGANLTLVGTPTVEWTADSTQSGAVPHNFTNNAGLLTFEILPAGALQVVAGDQFEIKITLSVDDTNAIGTQFFNTATWTFGRLIALDPNDDNPPDGDFLPTFFDPLPGENGVSEILTIGAPDLTVTKTSPDTALNIGVPGSFTIDVQNTGNTDAWDFTIIDEIPGKADNPSPPLTAGMCVFDPTATVTARIYQADGTTPVTPVLTAGALPGADYSLTFNNANPLPCELTLQFDGSGPNGAVLQPGQRLIITYTSELDPLMTHDGALLTNVAGATEWYSADPDVAPSPNIITRSLTDGTPGDPTDHESSYTITAGLSGYFFTKSVQNITSGSNPASTAASQDTLRYRLRVFNVDQTINNIAIVDNNLTSAFFDTSPGSFSVVSSNAASHNYDPVTGTLTIDGGDLNNLQELLFEFDIDLAAGLSNGTAVSNQAEMTATGTVSPTTLSDDPNVNGVDDPKVNPPNPDPTVVTIEQPGPPLKSDGPAIATIGDVITYRINVPEVPVPTALYDVRILDDLTASGADLEFVSATVVSGGSWTLTNTGTGNSLVIEDTGAGIDIPAGGQAVIDVTVRVSNTVANQAGVSFNNTASYDYNRVNNVSNPVSGGSDTTNTLTTLVEPGIVTITKTANNTTPTAGDTVRYSVTLTADSGVNISDVFDVTLSDTLDLGLVYVGNPTVTTGGAGGNGVGDGNTIIDADVTGDGLTTPQLLVWSTVEADIDIDVGETVTIEYDVLVLNSVLANATLNNSVVAQWTGIDGINTFERTGIDGAGGVLNDYATAPVVETLTTPGIVTTINKIRSTDTFGVGDDDVRIGDIVEYTLTIPVPEGTLGNLTLVDTLPQGLDFEAIVSLNGNTGPPPYTAVAPFTYVDIPLTNIVEAGDPTTGPTTVTWTLSDITNQPNDGLSDDFVIVYTARVLNGDVLTQQNDTPLNNQVSMTYDTATGTVNSLDIDTTINVRQPDLSITKTASPANGDVLVDDGEVVTYTVEITNNGTAPAYDVVLRDIIPVGLRTGPVTTTSISLVNAGTSLPLFAPTDGGGGITTWDFDSGTNDEYTIPPNGETLRVEYTVTADNPIAQGLTMTNTATVQTYYSLDDEAVSPTSPAASREDYPTVGPASTTLYTGALPTKALISPPPGTPNATIGDVVEYQITVPGTVNTNTLYDVQITDTLDANLEFISASIAGGIGVADNSTVTPSVLDVSVSEIPAGTQVVINLQARVRNVLTAQQGTTIDNTVSYSYAFAPAGPTQMVLVSIDSVTVNVVEPGLTAGKLVTPISPAPITGGDVLEYALTVQNTGSATAFDTSIVDTLPTGLTLDGSFTPTAAIDAIQVAGFVSSPAGAPGGPLVWGRDNADASLDIPAGSTLVLTYRVLIDASVESNITLTNSVLADWTSLDGASTDERTGAGCPTITAPDDYCSTPAISNVLTEDNNSFSKTIIDDSFAPNNDAIVRIGDTVTYQLSLNLQEGTTRSVAVNDVLPTGLVFDGIVSINGDTTADYTALASGAGSNFSYAAVTAGAVPTAGQTGTLTFTLGDVANDPLGDTTTDTLVIVYQARVPENILAQAPSTILSNTATLSYIDGNGFPVVDPARLEDTASIDVRQPEMTVPTKVDAVFTSPTQVDVATDMMQFTLESCNTTGLAPAYDVQLTDDLPTQLDETSLAGPINGAGQPDVFINGVLVSAGLDYNYTPPAGRGGSLVVDMLTPIPPALCVTVVYDIGFYTDFGPGQVWSNSVTVDEYWSLPAANGQQYTPLGPTIFIMSNAAVIGAPAKTMLSPASGEATIGEEVLYQILVPATVANAALYDVVVSDTLNAGLTFSSVTETSGNGFSITDNTSGNNVSLTIDQIPAGQQVQLELRARVANNASANAGTTINNTVSYSYATSPGGATNPGGNATTPIGLLVVEPIITINKAVANTSTVNPTDPPTAGDILRYTVSLTASGSGATGDQFSSAFDATVIDDLSLGLAYVAGTSTVDGGNTITDPAIAGDGITIPQTMTWQLADATANIDIPENTAVSITYDVIVLDGVLVNQALSNSAVAQWTGLDGIDANERTGTGTPVENDYFTAAATITVTTPDTTALTKSRLTDTSPPLTAASDVRVGDIVEYQLSAVLQEGLTSSVVLSDTLPQGLAFEGVVHVNGDTSVPYSAATPFVHADITPLVSGDPLAGPSTVSFNVGDITNVGDNNAANDTFVIVYRARVLDTVYPQVNNITLNNSAQLNYSTVAGPVTLTGTIGISLLQPSLSVAKTAVTAGGDTIIVAGELVTYTVEVTNSGTAPAYDLVVEDVIPAGMRNGAATITMLSTQLPVGNTVAIVAPVYNPATGNATWDFDTGVADAYTIQPGDTLQIVYRVQADPDLGAGLTLTNQAVASVYYSFDDDAVPALGGVTGVAEIYGPSNTDSTTLISPIPGALLKQTPFELSTVAADQFVAVGDTFSYRITVPEVPLPVALHDVRILDNLATSLADLSFVGVTAVGGPYTWIAQNTSGSATDLVIEDITNGIDIPAGQKIMLDVTVRVEDTANNISGLTFINAATYTYNQLAGDPLTQQNSLPDDSGDMIIIGPDALTMTKSGPATIRFGTPASYTLDVFNDNTGGFSAPAWDITITDVLPDLSPGGMCDTAPVITSAAIYDSTGTVLQTALTDPADYTASFAGCALTITMTSANAVLPPDSRLIITYDANLDSDTPPSTDLINIAGATEWFSNNTAGSGATGSTRTFTRTLTTDPVIAAAVPDHEDAHTVASEVPLIEVRKSVSHPTSGLPGTDAQPGDTLRYRIEIENVSPVDVPDFSFSDDLDALNAIPAFAAGTLILDPNNILPVSADSSGTNVNGGVNGTGLVSITSLALGADNSGTELVVIEFDVTLLPVITSGTVVLNQGRMLAPGVNQLSDDILIGGSADPTETLIASAPVFEVLKTSQDLSGDPAILLSGDTLRYTITVKNIGDENAINATLQDQLPANTSYVSGSTRLNGIAVADLAGGVLPLQNGILVNAPENTAAGFMRADTSATAGNVATVSFDVVINNNVVNGTIISNQAFLTADGAGSGLMPEKPSDDPATAVVDDPTLDVVGNQPLVDAHKTVAIVVDNGSPGIVDPGDVLRYTISISNMGATPATGVTFIDGVPANTSYRPDSAVLNGIPLGLPGATVSPLASGIDVSSSDLTPPLPTAGNGTLSAGGIAVVSFDVTVNDGVVNAPGPAATSGTIISNQGSVDSNELPAELTDADGIDTNGDQPTLIAVGNAQLLSITKQVAMIGGGPALAGGQLEYRVRVTNIGSVAATNVVITDNLDLPVAAQLNYIAGSGLLNGLPAGVSFTDPLITANFSAVYGDLQPGLSAELRFFAQIDNSLPLGTTITNTGVVSWNSPTQTASADVSIGVGGTPGVANLNGTLWHDANYNNVFDSGEVTLQGWNIDVYRSGQLLGSFITDSNGVYLFNGLLPNNVGTDRYELRFRAPGAGANTASLGLAESPYSNDLHRIYDIVVNSGDNLQSLNLPIDPNGIVYNSVLRTPVAGATLSLLNASNGNAPVPVSCLGDAAQQNQVTLAGGYYKFDMNFGAGCSAGDSYVIQITPPASGYVGTTSQIIPPTLPLNAPPFSVPSCPGSSDDRLSTSPEHCEIQVSTFAPAASVEPRTAGTAYYLKFTLGNSSDPYTSQIFNNHIPVDPELDEAVAISKTAALLNVNRSQLVPYTIVVNNSLGVPLSDMDIVDDFPAGFKYVADSARIDGVASEPVINGLQMTWPNQTLNAGEIKTIKMLLVVGSGVGEGEYVNRVQAINNRNGEPVSGQATATVRVIPDVTFDCSDVIGKVFADSNMNGYQDDGEAGIPSARVVTARGIEAKSDKHGRFHIACAVVPNEDRGSNFILKLDERSLPTGYRVTTENPRVERATRGKMLKFNFGVATHRVVRLDMADAVFESNSTEIRPQWLSRLSVLMERLVEAPSILRLAYMADVEDASLVEDRLKATRREIQRRWADLDCCYTLEIETEIFWRRGRPVGKEAFE